MATARKQLDQDIKDLKNKIKTNEQLLRDKGSVDQQIRDKTNKRDEAEQLAKLTESEASSPYS